MKSFIQLVGARLVPAVLTAAGVILVTAGLLSYADPATAGAAATPSQGIVEETLSPSDDAGVGLVSPSPEPGTSGSPVPTPSGSADPGATPLGTTPASIVPDPTKQPGRAVATRVVIPALNIDLPVVKGNEGYPYCNVAMYLHTANSAAKDALGQPGEGRATYLYGHARDGMFGPIYQLAMVKQTPGKMRGMEVLVYTSDFKLYLYRIKDVRLHATELTGPGGPIGATSEQLWLQTSEGPAGTPGKTQVIADFLSVSGADPGEAVPKARPIRCG